MTNNGFVQVYYIALGAILAIVGSIITQAYQNRRNKRNEYWIRKLNSYQDFYQHTLQLCKLLISFSSIPDQIFWNSISAARKAAFDASFYDKEQKKRTRRMEEITYELVDIFVTRKKDQKEEIQHIINQTESIMREFREEERL